MIEGVGEVSNEEVRAQETSVEGGLDEVERDINGTDETGEEFSYGKNDELQESYSGILRRYKNRQVPSEMIFKGVNRGKLLKKIKEVNKVLPFLPTEDTTEMNAVIAAVACYIGDKLEVKKRTRERERGPRSQYGKDECEKKLMNYAELLERCNGNRRVKSRSGKVFLILNRNTI